MPQHSRLHIERRLLLCHMLMHQCDHRYGFAVRYLARGLWGPRVQRQAQTAVTPKYGTRRALTRSAQHERGSSEEVSGSPWSMRPAGTDMTCGPATASWAILVGWLGSRFWRSLGLGVFVGGGSESLEVCVEATGAVRSSHASDGTDQGQCCWPRARSMAAAAAEACSKD